MRPTTKKIVYSALIAAIYAVLTYLLQPISYGAVQCRISEALTILPIYTNLSIPGLFIGCLVANILGGYGIWDIVLGSLTTLLAAVFTYIFRKNKYIAMIFPVVFNALIVGSYLTFLSYTSIGLVYNILTVGLGQFVACYIIGIPFSVILDKYKDKIFNNL